MEAAGHSCVEVPEREVECCERRDISRNTHYMLTEEEADSLRSDSRVRAVEKIDEIPELKKIWQPKLLTLTEDMNPTAIIPITFIILTKIGDYTGIL